MNVVAEEDESGVDRLPPPETALLAKLDHLRRMGEALPSNVAYCKPTDMIASP
jgi:hypothetical protein